MTFGEFAEDFCKAMESEEIDLENTSKLPSEAQLKLNEFYDLLGLDKEKHKEDLKKVFGMSFICIYSSATLRERKRNNLSEKILEVVRSRDDAR